MRASYPLLFLGATVAGEGAISSPFLEPAAAAGEPGKFQSFLLSLPSLFRIFGPPPAAALSRSGGPEIRLEVEDWIFGLFKNIELWR